MTVSLKIGNRLVGEGAPVFIIAEIGINHEGKEAEAAWLIERAAEAGADAVKFQTVDADRSYAPDTASYRAFKQRALHADAYERLMRQAADLGLIMFSTPGDLESLKLMVGVGMPSIKISSGQMTNVLLLRAAAETGLPLLISTGMADLDEVRVTVDSARQAGAREIAVLHCTSLYPAPAETLNLLAIATLRAELGLPVGYSDHYLGSLAAVAAMGACIIEKHFTRDCSQPGVDHALSLEPSGLADMVRQIRTVETMLGSAAKAPIAAELRLAPERRRYLVARRALAAGDTITPDAVTAMRVSCGDCGIPASAVDSALGRRLRRAVVANELLTEQLLEDRR
jgi:sialic acid synthase SpsE